MERIVDRAAASSVEAAIEARPNKYNIADYATERGLLIDVVDKGDRLECRCPFHDDKNPSFFISQGKNAFHCFSCGAHGGYVRFLTSVANEVDGREVSYYDELERLLRADQDVQLETGITTIFLSQRVLPSSYIRPLYLLDKERMPSTYSELVAYMQEQGFTNETQAKYAILSMQREVPPRKIYKTLMEEAGREIVGLEEKEGYDIAELLDE